MAMGCCRGGFIGLPAAFHRANAYRGTGSRLHASCRASACSAGGYLRHFLAAATGFVLLLCFQESLTRGMNKISVGRGAPGGAYIGSDLAAVIGRVHDHVHQDVFFRTAEAFALSVFVAEQACETVFLERLQVNLPKL